MFPYEWTNMVKNYLVISYKRTYGKRYLFSNPLCSNHRLGLPILHYYKIMVIYHYPFFVVITLFFYCIIFINDCIYIWTGSPVKYLFMVLHVIQKNWVNNNYPDSLNVMVNYQYHGKTGQLPGNSHLWF